LNDAATAIALADCHASQMCRTLFITFSNL
jgi:hypothetical protein